MTEERNCFAKGARLAVLVNASSFRHTQLFETRDGFDADARCQLSHACHGQVPLQINTASSCLSADGRNLAGASRSKLGGWKVPPHDEANKNRITHQLPSSRRLSHREV